MKKLILLFAFILLLFSSAKAQVFFYQNSGVYLASNLTTPITSAPIGTELAVQVQYGGTVGGTDTSNLYVYVTLENPSNGGIAYKVDSVEVTSLLKNQIGSSGIYWLYFTGEMVTFTNNNSWLYYFSFCTNLYDYCEYTTAYNSFYFTSAITTATINPIATQPKNGTYYVYDAIGNFIKQASMSDYKSNLNSNTLYIYIVLYNDGSFDSGKFIIE